MRRRVMSAVVITGVTFTYPPSWTVFGTLPVFAEPRRELIVADAVFRCPG
jgi:hypothetical protein